MPSLKLVSGLLAFGAAAAFHSGPGLPTEMVKNPGAGELAAPPPGALSTAGETPLDRDTAGERLTNPLPASPEALALGKHLFETYCAVCHGSAGAGDGPVGKKFGMPLPSLADPAIAERPDGYVYGTIRDGGFVMPSHAELMTPEERWAVVHHVRSLQRR
jgi:mono/diheme cytochrome c family protein